MRARHLLYDRTGQDKPDIQRQRSQPVSQPGRPTGLDIHPLFVEEEEERGKGKDKTALGPLMDTPMQPVVRRPSSLHT